MKRRYYHASPHRHSPGDILAGRPWSREREGKLVVFMTQSPVPHATILEEALDENWLIYEVLPLRKVKNGRMWDEVYCQLVEVLKCLGNARGIYRNASRRWKPRGISALYPSSPPGSVVIFKGRLYHKNCHIPLGADYKFPNARE